MSIAILCPGPSLQKTWMAHGFRHEGKYSLILAVNRAALVQRPHWWVAGDWAYLKNTPARPLLGFCTTREVIGAIQRGVDEPTSVSQIIPIDRWHAGGKEMIAWEDLPFQRSYSTVAAIGLAIYLRKRVRTFDQDIHIFGDDKSGEADFDGRIGENRGENRWQEEISFTKDAIDCAHTHGMRVSHIRE